MGHSEVEFVTPPPAARGGRPQVSEDDEVLCRSLRDRPGGYVEYGQYASEGEAESVRRRINRGAAPWTGGRSAWSVLVRKQDDDEWRVYVAFEAMGVAS